MTHCEPQKASTQPLEVETVGKRPRVRGGTVELRRSRSLGEDALKKVRNVSEPFFRFFENFSENLKSFQNF